MPGNMSEHHKNKKPVLDFFRDELVMNSQVLFALDNPAVAEIAAGL